MKIFNADVSSNTSFDPTYPKDLIPHERKRGVR